MKKYYRLLYSKTPKIKDSEGKVKKDSIASLERIKLGGLEQAVLIRGHNIYKPILLSLHGGPGTVDMPIAHHFNRELEKHFIMVNWDQRGAGKSYSKDISVETMKIDQFIADLHELVQYLLNRFNKEQLIIQAHSWGTELGLRFIKKYQNLIKAYIGVGQVVHHKRQEEISFDHALKLANDQNNEEAIKELEDLIPYTGSHEEIEVERKWLTKLGGTFYEWDSWNKLFKIGFSSPEYSLIDLYKFFKGSLFTLNYIPQQTEGTDFFTEIPKVDVPVYFLQGKYDYVCVSELVEEYYNQLEAPRKKLIWFEKSGHCPNFEQPEKFQEILIYKILPEINLIS